MRRNLLATVCVACALIVTAFGADFQYTEKTEVTGGSLKSMMGIAAKLSRQPSGPITTTHSYRGDRMASRGDKSVTIIDLGSETITSADLDRKEYSTITFAEMAEAMKQMSEKMAGTKGREEGVKMSWKSSADATGQTRQVAGVTAKEIILKVEVDMEKQGDNRDARGAMRITVGLWHARVPGDAAVREFQKKMAQKMAWQMNLNPMMMAQMGPGMVEGMQEAGKKIAEMEGMPLLTVTRMGADASGTPEGSAGAPERQEPAQEKPSIGSAIGGALGGRLGGFGRRKKQDEQPPASTSSPAPAAAPASRGVLLETTTEVISFSSSAVDPAVFDVPAGFKQVEHPMKKAMK